MARSNYNNSHKMIYEIAKDFREKCLFDDCSLISGDGDIWKLENLQKIHNCFIANPAIGKLSFIEKFENQIKPEGNDVIRLAAELLCVYFLFPSSVRGVQKRKVVNEVLGWVDSEPQQLMDNHPISKAFEYGLGSGGYGYNTRRPFELAFLITFMLEWKNLPLQEKQDKIWDPWEFQNYLDTIQISENLAGSQSSKAGSWQIRHMLLHLLFPEYFENIATNNHKRQIIDKFSCLIENEVTENQDLNLFNIRAKLENLIPGKELDFYKDPLRAAWYDETTDSSEDIAPVEALLIKKQIVLYGPPGTGKTYRAKQLAEKVIRAAALDNWTAAQYFESEAEIKKAILNNTHRLQLHPSYGYEDFVRGLHINAEGATEYRLGYLPELIKKIEDQKKSGEKAGGLPHVLILDEMNRTDLSRMLGECFSLLEDRDQTIDLPARNSNGTTLTLRIPDNLFVIGTMNLIDQSIEQIDFALRRRFLWLSCPFNADALLVAAESRWKERKRDKNALPSWERVEPDFQRLAVSASNLNNKIKNSQLLGSQYEIGHTYFLDIVDFLYKFIDNSSSRKNNHLWNNKGNALEPVYLLWKLSLQPLLEQYLMGYDTNARNEELKGLSEVFLKAGDWDDSRS